MSGAQIALTFTDPTGASTVHNATTLSDGTFADQLTGAGSSGTWHVQAAYAGDGAHGPASASQDVTFQ